VSAALHRADEAFGDFPCLDAWDEADEMEAAANAIDFEHCCDTVPGELTPEEIVRESERESVLLWYLLPVAFVLAIAISAIYPTGFQP
jgi:hypothetical protein